MDIISRTTNFADPSHYYDPASQLRHQAQKFRWMGFDAEAAQAECHLKELDAALSKAITRSVIPSIDTALNCSKLT